MKAKKFLVILCLLAVALLAVACGEDETTTAEPVVTTTAEATTTAATTTKAATTTAATTTVAATTKATTKATTAATTTVAATTAAPAPVAPADPYLWNGNVATAFAGGTGTAEDPYQIANGAQLALMAESFEKGAYYILVDDIMLNDVYNWNEWGNGYLRPLNPWTPIEGFNANFDGKGKTIYGLYGIPLFKSTKDASITNIGLAYTQVNGAVLVADACDTNIVGITIDTDTLVFDGKDDITFSENATIDDIMAATGTKWYITLGSNPTVWDFEALAVGALATDLYVANDKLGTAFNVTIVDGKGYVENEGDGEKALAWDANDATGNTLVLNITKDATALTNWSGADEVLVYVDGTEQAGAYKFGISLIDAAGKTYTIAKDKNVQTLDGKAWKEFKSTGANFELEDGYNGWVRAPFAAFVDADGKALDAANVNIAQIAFYYENASATDAGVFYIDAVKILDADGAWTVLPNTVPTLNPAYGVTVIETFGENTTATGRVPDNHAANGATSIKDGKFLLTALNNAGPDFYVDLNKEISADVKGFLVYVDLDKVNIINDGTRDDGLKKSVKLGLQFRIDSKNYAIGNYEKITFPDTDNGTKDSSYQANQNAAYILDFNGEWRVVYNTDNNRIVLPTRLFDGAKSGFAELDEEGKDDYFTGWMYIPVSSLSEGGSGSKFLADYLASKTDDVKLEYMLAYTSNLGKDSVMVLDQVMAVYGEDAPEAALPENVPANMPNDIDYKIMDTLDFNDADEIFYVREGAALVANGGIDDSACVAITSKAGATTEITVSTSVGNNLNMSQHDDGFLLYIDLSGVTPKEGTDYVGFGFGVGMSYDEQFRNDGSSFNKDHASYWNFYLRSEKNSIGYIQNEDGEWVEVNNKRTAREFDIPAGYVGYLFVPTEAISRNGNAGNTNSFRYNANGPAYYTYIRFYRMYLGNVQNADEKAIVDDISIVNFKNEVVNVETSAPETYMPATLPKGKTYEVVQNFGFETEDEFAKFDGTDSYTKHSIDADRAVSGKALHLIIGRKDDKSNYVKYQEQIHFNGFQSLKDVRGIMVYVDASKVIDTADNTFSFTLTIDVNNQRTKTEAPAYILANGTTEWVEVKQASASNDRYSIPTGFVGWVYIPLTSYSDAMKLVDKETGLGRDEVYIENFRIYTDHFDVKATQAAGGTIVIDELTYVK